MTCYLDREAATSRHSSCIEAQVAVILRSANGCNFFKHAFERVQYSREGVSFANGGLHDYTFSVTTMILLPLLQPTEYIKAMRKGHLLRLGQQGHGSPVPPARYDRRGSV